MRFIFKQSCFIACFMIYDAWGVIPDYLVKLEQEFWSGLRLSATAKKGAKKAVQKILNPQVKVGPSEEIDFSDMKKWEIVKHLDLVQEKKHEARLKTSEQAKNLSKLPRTPDSKSKKTVKIQPLSKTPNKIYKTSFNKDGSGDPSPEKISYGGLKFKISLNYDGSPYTKQPGNLCLIPNGEFFTSPIRYDNANGINLDAPDVKLLLLTEISRRHAEDKCREGDEDLLGGLDEFHDLPVGLGLAMANELISKNEIRLHDFWIKGRTYHLYTGDKATREEAFEQLCEKYQQTYMQNFSEEKKKISLLDLLNRYFEVPEENLGLSEMFESLSLSSHSDREEGSEENPFISDSSSEI